MIRTSADFVHHALSTKTERLKSVKSAPAIPVKVPEMTKVTSRTRRTLRPRNSARWGFSLVARRTRPNAEWVITHRSVPATRTVPSAK